jgi:hypothetical protein
LPAGWLADNPRRAKAQKLPDKSTKVKAFTDEELIWPRGRASRLSPSGSGRNPTMFLHTLATDLLSRGIPIEDASELLGTSPAGSQSRTIRTGSRHDESGSKNYCDE